LIEKARLNLFTDFGNYFDNLLPDDRRVRERIAAKTQANGTQPFDLLSAVGRDCVGALQFYPGDQEPSPMKPARGKPLSDQEIAELIRGLRLHPLGINLEEDFRISLAGAQSKTALLFSEGRWLRPIGATPTTHIFKPTIGPVVDGPDLSLSVENEWLCLKIVQAFDLPAAKAELARFEDVKVLIVERFDRKWVGNKLYRIPQEDMCQALGFGTEEKYQADGGPGIRDILSLLNESDQRDRDRRIFMKSQIVFWLLAAIDGHAKNFSIFIRPNGFELTPLYDVMSGDPHVNPKTLPHQKIKLAMAVGDNRRYRVNEVLRRHWLQTAGSSKFADIDALLEEICNAVPKVIELVSAEIPSGFPASVSDSIFKAIQTRTAKLSSSNS